MFTILTAGAVFEEFDVVVSNAGMFDVHYAPTSVTVETIVAPVPGDVDGDLIVDVADLVALLAAWGPCDGDGSSDCKADLNCDGVVAVGDLIILLANWTS
jgi:hypothetical protein